MLPGFSIFKRPDGRQRRGRRPLIVLGFFASVVLFVGLLSRLQFMMAAESTSGDWRLRARGVQPIKVPIVIIDIDEATITSPALKEPMYFWGKHHADVLDSLRDMGAKAIGFDFVQPADLENYAKPNPDQAEAQAIMATPQLVMASTRHERPDGRFSEILPNKLLRLAMLLSGKETAVVNTLPEPDGIIRRFAPLDADGKTSFDLAVAEIATGQQPKWQGNMLVLGALKIPLNHEREGIINYVGPTGSFPHISYQSFLAHPKTYRKQVQGSICLIGAGAYELQDIHSSPFSHGGRGNSDEAQKNFMAGTEVHANIIHTLLTGQPIVRIDGEWSWLFVALAAFLVIPLFWLRRVSLMVPLALLLTAGWVGVCFVAFVQWDRLLPLVAPVIAMLLNQSLLVGFRLGEENANRRWLQNAFGRSVSPPVLEHLRNNPDAATLGGKRQIITSLFSDIRGFTEISESLDPEQVTWFLNIYLDKMVDIIFEHGGTVNKFLGDGIMVLYNWPVEQEDHAARALMSAVKMQQALEANAEEWRALGLPNIHIGIGIHTGHAVVGNIGGRQTELTAIGDTVNVASRLEGLCKTVGKAVGSSILLSDTAWQAAQPGLQTGKMEFEVIAAGETEIRGRTQPMQLYGVLQQRNHKNPPSGDVEDTQT